MDVSRERSIGLLLLSRKQGERVVIGRDIEVTVARITGNRVTLAIQAPDELPIRRHEIPEDPEKQAKRLTSKADEV